MSTAPYKLPRPSSILSLWELDHSQHCGTRWVFQRPDSPFMHVRCTTLSALPEFRVAFNRSQFGSKYGDILEFLRIHTYMCNSGAEHADVLMSQALQPANEVHPAWSASGSLECPQQSSRHKDHKMPFEATLPKVPLT